MRWVEVGCWWVVRSVGIGKGGKGRRRGNGLGGDEYRVR